MAVGQLRGTTIAVAGGRDGTVRVWDVAARKQIGRPLTGHRAEVSSVAVGPAGASTIAVSGSRDGTVRTWSLGQTK